MTLTVRFRNMGSLQAKLKKMDASVRVGALAALNRERGPFERDVKKDLRTGVRSGRIVKRYRPERRVRTSAPGERPARDTGALARSVKVTVDPIHFNMRLSAFVRYAKFLEYGTRKMLPRPFLRPSLSKWRPRIVSALQDEIKRKL